MRLILTETFKMVINPWVPVYLQSPINYSNNTHTLPLTQILILIEKKMRLILTETFKMV